MFKKLLAKNKVNSYEKKIKYPIFFSIALNYGFALGKTIFTIISGSFVFLISAAINILMAISKKECYLGIINKVDKFKKRNLIISILVILSGFLYVIYMGRLIINDIKTFQYDFYLSVSIAFVSFLEMGFAIAGILKVKNLGHFYRSIKIINFSSACSAIMLTQVALLSFTETPNANIINGLSGVGIGIFMMILGLFILILPNLSFLDREHNVYYFNSTKEDFLNSIKQSKDSRIILHSNNHLEIIFSNNYVYGKYSYYAKIYDDRIEGDLKHERHFFKKLHWSLKILVIILSEILIFVWFFGRVIDFIKNANLPRKLDKLISKFNVEKCNWR